MAESVAFTVCGFLGLDTAGNSVPYLAVWSEHTAEDAFERIAALVDRLARRLEDALQASRRRDGSRGRGRGERRGVARSRCGRPVADHREAAGGGVGTGLLRDAATAGAIRHATCAPDGQGGSQVRARRWRVRSRPPRLGHPHAQPPPHQPPRGADRPTAKQLRYLRALANSRGQTFTYPTTKAQASAEIRRLQAHPRREPRRAPDRARPPPARRRAARRRDRRRARTRSPATAPTPTGPTPDRGGPVMSTAGTRHELARYQLPDGTTRALFAQRINGRVAITDLPPPTPTTGASTSSSATSKARPRCAASSPPTSRTRRAAASPPPSSPPSSRGHER